MCVCVPACICSRDSRTGNTHPDCLYAQRSYMYIVGGYRAVAAVDRVEGLTWCDVLICVSFDLSCLAPLCAVSVCSHIDST